MDDQLTLACKAGDVNALYELIGEDADILKRLNKIMFVHTPLHIAASDGQARFAMELMNLMPSFARKLNKSGFSPMHLALLNGHSQLVLLFLRADYDLVRVKGRDGMTPLHFACTKHGNVDLLASFLVACPESIEDLTTQGETALHVAVKSNRFDAIEVLVGWLRRVCHEKAFHWERNIPNWKDEQGHTILDIAVSNNMQHEVLINLLAEINARTSEGLTVLDIMGRNRLLKILCCVCGTYQQKNDSTTLTSYIRSKPSFNERLAVYITRHKMKISDDVRNILLVVAGFITASTLQVVLSGNNNGSEATPTPHLSDRAIVVFLLSSLYNNTAFCIVNGLIALLLPEGLFGMIMIRLLPVSLLFYIFCIQRGSPNGLVMYNLLVFFLAYAFVFLAFVTYSKGRSKLRKLQKNTNNFSGLYRKRKAVAADQGQARSATSDEPDPEM